MRLANVLSKLTLLVALTVVTAPSFATIIHVPADQPTIQAGITAAQEGDTVWIGPGTFTGAGNRDLDLQGKAIVVTGSRIGSRLTTTIDCEGGSATPHRAFDVSSGEDTTTVVEFLRITGAAAGSNNFGAIQTDSASPFFRNCLLYDNSCTAVISHRLSRPIFENCQFVDNQYGIVVGEAWTPVSGLILRKCDIVGNILGGILVLGHDTVDIGNCTIRNNLDGIFMQGSSEPPPTGVDFDIVIRNTITAYNGLSGMTTDGNLRTPLVTCCNSYGNIENYVNGPAFAGDTLGNISVNPLLGYGCNDTLMVNIPISSPCAASNNSCGVTIGAHEPFVQAVCCNGITGDVTADQQLNLTDLTMLVNHLFVTFEPLGCRPEGNVNGDTDCDINLTDVTKLVNHLFVTFEPIANCGDFDYCACYAD